MRRRRPLATSTLPAQASALAALFAVGCAHAPLDESAGSPDAAGTAGDAPAIGVAPPEWPVCSRLEKPLPLDTLAAVSAAVDLLAPGTIGVITCELSAGSARDADCPDWTEADGRTTASGACTTAEGSTFQGEYAETFDGIVWHAVARDFAFVDGRESAHHDACALDGEWQTSLDGESRSVRAAGTSSISVDPAPSVYQGDRTDDGGFSCLGDVCSGEGYVSLGGVDGLTGDVCYAGAGARWLEGDVGDVGDGVVRLVGGERVEVRFNDQGRWISIDGGAWIAG